MHPPEREMAQRRGRRKLDAMRRRAGQLRRRVVVTAIVGFAVLWTAVFVQMATGNDPVLGTGTVARSGGQKKPASGPERRGFQAAVPPPSEGPERVEAERVEAERIEIEQREAEARELEELEAVTTGQS